MLNLSDITVFLPNSQITPTFLENTVLVLTKDYSILDPVCNRDLKKGVAGVVTACGFSIYAFNEDTQSFSTLIDGNEWCGIEVQPSIPDFDYTEGCVMAKDLREVSVEDLEFDSFCSKKGVDEFRTVHKGKYNARIN